MFGINPRKLRASLREDDSSDMKRRRWIIGLSVFGMANMALATLIQMGMIKRLPDVGIKGFDTNKVNTSDDAYRFGTPDGPVELVNFASNIALAAFGDANRVKEHPWVPIAALAKSIASGAASAWYIYRMPAKEKAWCAYCLMTGLTEMGILALTVPEAMKALHINQVEVSEL